MTPEDFPGELGASFSDACSALGVPVLDRGYGLVLELDDRGARWTRVTSDVRGVCGTMALWHSGMEAAYEPSARSVVATLSGWPVECGLGLLGFPEPHDPPGEHVLRAPERWGPARRRAMEDVIVRELEDSGHQAFEEYQGMLQWDHWNLGETDTLPPELRLIDRCVAIPAGHSLEAAVSRAVAAAWQLATTGKPPRGSVRCRETGISGHRVVRATGDGWNLAGRTGSGLVVVLLDQAPGVAIDITATEKLPELLDALTAAADRVPEH
jgi:hypothetical protein